MDMNDIRTTVVNETIRTKSAVNNDTFIILAGHLLIIFYCLIFILGFLGNFVVIYVGIRKKKYRNVTNCYVMNLALADLLFLTLSMPHTTYLGLIDAYPFGKTLCKIYMYLAYVFLLATCNTLAAMSIDRYFYIVLPRSKLYWHTPQTALMICLIIWIGSLALIIPYHMITMNITSCGVNDEENFFVCLFIFCSYYAIPLLIITICYTKLAMHVIESNRLVLSQMNSKVIPKSLQTKQRRVTKMVVVVTLAFAICWLPIHILELMKCANSSILYTLIRSYPKVLYTIRAFTHALAYFNSCLNPYLYALLNRNFCYDLIDIVPSYCTYCKQSCLLGNTNTLLETKIVSSTVVPNVNFGRKKLSNDNDDVMCYQKKVQQSSIDVACQVELVSTEHSK